MSPCSSAHKKTLLIVHPWEQQKWMSLERNETKWAKVSGLGKQHDTRLSHGPQDLNCLTTEGLLHLWFSFMSSTVRVGRKTILWPKFHVEDVQTLAYIASVSFLPCLVLCFHSPFFCFVCDCSLACSISSPGRSGDGAGKERRACNYISGIWISASKKSCENLCWLVEMTLVVTSLPKACVFNVCLHSCSFLLRTYWQYLTAQSTGSHRGIGGGIQITET